MMDFFAMWIGYVVMTAGGLSIAFGLLAAGAVLNYRIMDCAHAKIRAARRAKLETTENG